MPRRTFTILLCLNDDDESGVTQVVQDLDTAINDIGLFSGNFLVKTGPSEEEFWAEWKDSADVLKEPV